MNELRECDVCGVLGPAEGPLEWMWDAHLVTLSYDLYGRAKQEMKLSCGPDCRKRRGWLERKVK